MTHLVSSDFQVKMQSEKCTEILLESSETWYGVDGRQRASAGKNGTNTMNSLDSIADHCVTDQTACSKTGN